jgi:hypothetical protein
VKLLHEYVYNKAFNNGGYAKVGGGDGSSRGGIGGYKSGSGSGYRYGHGGYN